MPADARFRIGRATKMFTAAGRVVALSLTTTGNGDGGEDPRLMRMALAAYGVEG